MPLVFFFYIYNFKICLQNMLLVQHMHIYSIDKYTVETYFEALRTCKKHVFLCFGKDK